jgi:hypothetical protein
VLSIAWFSLLALADIPNLETTTFSIDPDALCVNSISYLPATVSAPNDPILLLQPGNDVNNFHGLSLQRLKDSSTIKRSRDIFFVTTCGAENKNIFGAAAFVNFLIQPLPDAWFFKASHGYELTSANKLEIARVLEKFSRLSKVGFVWNSKGLGLKSLEPSSVVVPIATAQMGFWEGSVSITDPNSKNALETLVRGTKNILDQNQSWKRYFQSLHTELAQMTKLIAASRPWWERILYKIYPRVVFNWMDAPSSLFVSSSWEASNMAKSPNDDGAILSLEYRFLGEKTLQELEDEVERKFRKYLQPSQRFEVRTNAYSPFRRSFFEDAEAKAFQEVLSAYPEAIIVPAISAEINDSRFFRMVGIKTFDFAPDVATAIDIETNILQKLLR